VTYLLLAAVYLVAGGKAYYLAGAYPVLLAAGAISTDGWLARGAARRRARYLAVALGLSAVTAGLIGLSLLPVRHLGPVLAVNPDAGEMVGWPAFTDEVARVWSGLPAAERAQAVILTQNYGEAGAIDRYGPDRGLPAAYSGHNGFAYWAVPPDTATTAVVTGYDREGVELYFASCTAAGRVDNGVDVDNDEQGGTVWVCRDPRRPWSALWPQLRHLG
jgi:hypothetical protein